MVNPYAKKLEQPLVAHAERIGKIMAQRTLSGMADAGDPYSIPEVDGGKTQAPGFTKDNSKEMEALQERMAGRLAIIRESFMTESELSAAHRDEDLATLKTALEQKLLSEQEHRSLVEQLEGRHQKTLQNIRDRGNHAMLAGAGQVLGSLANVLRTEGEKHLEIVKGLSIAQALIAAYTGAAEALKLPFPANIAAFAGVLAKGLGAVASIKSIKSGSSGGGAPGGGGGGGGASSAAPVAAQQQGGGQTAGTITIEGLRRADLFNGDSVVELMEAMMQKQRDGYNLVIAR